MPARSKQILGFSLVFLMAMNTLGNYAFLVLLREQIASTAALKIRSNPNEPGADMIVKVPLSVPYMVDSEDYEPTRGQFTHEGNVYQTTKRRFYQDTLYLVCVFDYRTTAADHKISDMAKAFAGDGEDAQGNALKLMLTFAKYCPTAPQAVQTLHPGWVMECSFATHAPGREQFSEIIIFHPPRLAA